MSRKIIGRTVGTTLNPEKLKGQAGVGANGKSAYEIWLEAGNTGTEADFLASLEGADGYSPVRGTDYWTETDKTEIKSYCQDYIDTELLGGAS